MTDYLFTRTHNGLVPADKAAAEWLAKRKLGSTIAMTGPREVRNAAFHRKFFALLDLAYDYWEDAVEEQRGGTEYKGQPVLPDRERFRKDITILAGFYRPVVNVRGETRLEPESIKWGSMTEERFNQLYDKVITVLLSKIFNGRVCKEWGEEELRRVAEQILEFAA